VVQNIVRFLANLHQHVDHFRVDHRKPAVAAVKLVPQHKTHGFG
jgi:hypothetical protein